MIWLIWRQHRREALIFGGMIALIAAYMIVAGNVMYAAYYQTIGGVSVAACQRLQEQGSNPGCSVIDPEFFQTYGSASFYVMAAIALLPPLLGMFLGAPLVARELESGTFRLIWTQGVTRRRWLWTKIGALALFILLAGVVFIPLMRWWQGPLGWGTGLGGSLYDFEGTVPLAYLAFALALGIAAGALLRRTIPAMAATLVGYVAVRLPIEQWVRPYFLPPLSTTWDPYLTDASSRVGNQDWTIFLGYVDRAGHQVSMLTALDTCARSSPTVDFQTGSTFNACIQAHGWLSLIVWQPADRYWAFQGIESAIFVGLALALVALTLWWVRTRLS